MTFSFAPISLGHTKPQDELDEALVGGQKKLDQDKDGDIDAKDFAMLRGKKKKKKNEDEPEGENGETAAMNPKMATTKEDTDFSKAIDIVRKHSKQSEIRGSGGGTTVTAEHPRGQNATKADRMAHTNMLKDKLKHLKSVKVVHKTYPGSATESVGKTPGDDSYHNLQKAKRMAAADGHDYDKLPAYDRTSNKHKDYYDNKAKNEGVNENNPAHYAAIAAADKRHRERMGVKPVPNMNDPKFKMTKKDKMTKDPMNPTGAMTGYRSKIKDHVEKDGNMSIREKLISVVERANHGNMDSQETYDDMYKGAGAKKMRKDHQNMKVDTTRKLGVDDASKAGKAIKKAPMRRADNPKGDINIVPAGTPMKDPAASKDTALENVMAAYKSMNEVSQELAFKAADKAETNRKKSKGPFDRSPNYAKRDRQATKFTQAGMYRQYKDGKLTTGEGGLKIGKRKKTDENVMAAYKSMSENKDHVMVDADVVLPKAHDNPTKGKTWAEKYGQRKGGPSMKVHSYTHDGPGGGNPAVTYKGHVKDAMKFHNHHYDENYSLDHDGHKKMKKDYGG